MPLQHCTARAVRRHALNRPCDPIRTVWLCAAWTDETGARPARALGMPYLANARQSVEHAEQCRLLLFQDTKRQTKERVSCGG